MNCPKCGCQLQQLIRCLSPVEQRDEVRVLDDDAEEGLRVEFTGEMEIRQNDGTQQWVECPHCGHDLDDVTADGLEFVHRETPASESIRLDDASRARGRNGLFRPAELSVGRSEAEHTIGIAVRSHRMYADMPPIHLTLGVADAELLLAVLKRQVAVLSSSRSEGKQG
ncbi:MAG: hypothetical protein ABFE01_02210 [Phycisphaerales bacterium]